MNSIMTLVIVGVFLIYIYQCSSLTVLFHVRSVQTDRHAMHETVLGIPLKICCPPELECLKCSTLLGSAKKLLLAHPTRLVSEELKF